MNRRDFLKTTIIGGVPVAAPALTRAAVVRARDSGLEEATARSLQRAMDSGRETASSLVRKYSRRIEQIDRSGPKLNSIIELNPDAPAIARELDRERASRGPRGPLHGIPVVIKDNINTRDRMLTTAGSLALLESRPPEDAFVVRQLRKAGAVVLGKTNLSEWANFRSTRSTSGWSARGGLTKNPYVLDRNPSGSSSGTGAAIAANLAAVGIGTETDGSITSPASYNGLVGLKPTIGLVGRTGIIPIAHSQDTAGPMTRTVEDAALLLGVLAATDPDDAVTREHHRTPEDYTRALDPKGLRGARIGVARQFFKPHPDATSISESALEILKSCGAILVDPADIPSYDEWRQKRNLVLYCEFKADLAAYLARLGPSAPVKTLQDVIDFNERNRDKEMPWFGQELFLRAQEMGPLTDAAYLETLERNKRMMRKEGIDAVMDRHRLDALVAPTTGPAHVTDLLYGDADVGACTTPAAVAGYPHITVPAGNVSGLPVGLSFFGPAFSESVLLKLAYGFEQALKARKPPQFLSSLRI